MIVIVAAVADNGVIGVDNQLPWRLPEDLRRFKEITLGSALVMGRRTYESIGRALPGRDTVVVTRSTSWDPHDDVTVVHGVPEALEAAAVLRDVVCVVGGADVYRQTLDVADRLALTEVHAEPEGDTHFPAVDWIHWRETSRMDCDGYSFVDYIRA